jgi:putative addiction module component (TIGR02574 family)
MDITTVRREVSNWPVDQRLELIEGVWDEIAASNELPDLTPVQAAELDRRARWLKENPDKTESWDEVEAFLSDRK